MKSAVGLDSRRSIMKLIQFALEGTDRNAASSEFGLQLLDSCILLRSTLACWNRQQLRQFIRQILSAGIVVMQHDASRNGCDSGSTGQDDDPHRRAAHEGAGGRRR